MTTNLDQGDEIEIPARNLRVGMTFVSPVSGRRYVINELQRIGGSWVRIESDSPASFTKELDDDVKVVMESHEF